MPWTLYDRAAMNGRKLFPYLFIKTILNYLLSRVFSLCAWHQDRSFSSFIHVHWWLSLTTNLCNNAWPAIGFQVFKKVVRTDQQSTGRRFSSQPRSYQKECKDQRKSRLQNCSMAIKFSKVTILIYFINLEIFHYNYMVESSW